MRLGLLDAIDAAPSLVSEMLDREMSPGVALMAALALDPEARAVLDATLGSFADPTRPLPPEAGEVIVGGGAHAAVYAAVRVASGYPAPLVLDAPENGSQRFGGAFAGTVTPAFYLNSRNRPGPGGTPGTRDALNVLPAAPMQPADIGGSEYQTDADLGLIVRCALALNATVRTARVLGLDLDRSGGPVVITERGAVAARRVIVATGVGRPLDPLGIVPDGRTIYSFRQWMDRIGSDPFPLRDLGRVAVIGSGDGARTVIESLAGIGPRTGASVASLDYVPRIDWYGPGSITKSEYCSTTRTRYARIGALLPAGRENARIVGRDRARVLAPGYLAAQVDGRAYDTVIGATGYSTDPTLDLGPFGFYRYGGAPGGSGVGAYARKATEAEVYRVGPAARLPFDSTEDDRIGENQVGLFRLAPRTATLASRLDGVTA